MHIIIIIIAAFNQNTQDKDHTASFTINISHLYIHTHIIAFQQDQGQEQSTDVVKVNQYQSAEHLVSIVALELSDCITDM